ncbi:hypothetical protein AX768_31000 (plasmid) [Burkholderia sp. PAMC 28687]|nr:hypothetical protein AX768_31000 [Burkholderia sp. PAMC 28687]
MDIERGGREQVCERSTLLDRVISLHQIFVSRGCPEQKDDIEPTGVPFNQRLPSFPVDVDALAIALAPFVEDEKLFTLPLGCMQRGREQRLCRSRARGLSKREMICIIYETSE